MEREQIRLRMLDAVGPRNRACVRAPEPADGIRRLRRLQRQYPLCRAWIAQNRYVMVESSPSQLPDRN